MDEGNSEKGPVIKGPIELRKKAKPKNVEGPGFTMEDSASSYSSGSRASVQMRIGASNKEELRKLHEERARFESLSLEEKARVWERKEIQSTADWFESMIKAKDEYSEMLKINSDGRFDLNARFNSKEFPYIPIHGVFKPDDLYEFMQKLREQNPHLNIQFDSDSNGQWIKYKVTKSPQTVNK